MTSDLRQTPLPASRERNMNRRTFLNCLIASSATGLSSCTQAEDAPVPTVKKTDAQWRELLSDEAFEVLFEEATERPHSSALNKEKRAGTYVCAACFLPLFDSDTKYESGTGWPSFWKTRADAIGTKKDYKLILPRIEYHCVRCGGHQGHVFDDGPEPTGLRYCNNGVALRFVPKGEALPELRT